MIDLFAPLSIEARRANRLEFRQFLADRDGVVDAERRTLSNREKMMERHLRPVPDPRPLDRVLFDAQYAAFDARRETPPEMLLLLALVKTNAAEAYGVNRVFDAVYRRTVASQDDLEMIVVLEETYHTKILLSTSRLYGLDVTAPFLPRAALKALIGGIATMPEFMARPLTLASEILGTITFMNLLGAAGRILKDDPELRDSVEERITEILIDEIGHISYNRMLLGRAGLAQARALLPLVAYGMRSEIAEIGALGIAATADTAAIVSPSALPEAVRRTAYLA
jgi:hypothetical protein